MIISICKRNQNIMKIYSKGEIKMKNILLACSAGMSTSLLVNKMEEAAVADGIKVNIKAMSSDNAFHSLDEYDVLLIGPQMRFMKKKIMKAAEEKGLELPIETIDSVSYGRIDGEGVLKQALKLLGE